MYKIVYTKKAVKDIEKIKQSSIKKKAKSLIEVIKKIHTKPHHLMKNC